MSTENVTFHAPKDIPSAVRFDVKKDFHTYTQQQDKDRAFVGCKRLPWVPQRVSRDSQRDRETLAALLTSSAGDDCVNKFLEEDISFRDLASLTSEDLELLGFSEDQHRQDLLKLFAVMPNQDPSYNYIWQQPEAINYQSEIVGNASSHLMTMRACMTANKYKLRLMPPEDGLVGDKRYASRFALEALESVQRITNELFKDVHKLVQVTSTAARDPNGKKSGLTCKIAYWTVFVFGTACAWWWWTKRNSPIKSISI